VAACWCLRDVGLRRVLLHTCAVRWCNYRHFFCWGIFFLGSLAGMLFLGVEMVGGFWIDCF
jgi:hypothetical protein